MLEEVATCRSTMEEAAAFAFGIARDDVGEKMWRMESVFGFYTEDVSHTSNWDRGEVLKNLF